MNDSDPFDLDDLKPRHATELDTFLAAGVREVEQQRACVTVEIINCPDCDGDGYCTACGGDGLNEDDHDADGRCSPCEGTGGCAACDGTGTNGDCEIISPADTLARAWEAASEEGQAVS